MNPDWLSLELDRFDTQLPVDRAWTPPASWYVDPRFAELEKRTVFRQGWVAVGSACDVGSPGDYITAQVGDDPIVVVRGEDGILRAFHNVCRHHATCVAEGAGNTDTLVCPYHGWTYGLDGRLKSARRIGAIKDFDRSEFGLHELAVAHWGAFVFVHPGPRPGDLSAQLQGLTSRMDQLVTDNLRYVAREFYEVECNWKVFVDNYLDGGYHIPTLHKGLDRELDEASYKIETFDGYSIQSSQGTDAADALDRIGGGALYAYIYPNFFINRYGPIMDTNLLLPLSADRCLVVFDYYFEASCDEAFISASMARSRVIQEEDESVCASVHRGLKSSAYDVGRYAPALEHAMHHFHVMLAESLRRSPE